jgi:hypothetical protein
VCFEHILGGGELIGVEHEGTLALTRHDTVLLVSNGGRDHGQEEIGLCIE